MPQKVRNYLGHFYEKKRRYAFKNNVSQMDVFPSISRFQDLILQSGTAFIKLKMKMAYNNE